MQRQRVGFLDTAFFSTGAAAGLLVFVMAGCGAGDGGHTAAESDGGVSAADASSATIKTGVGPGGCTTFESSFQAIQKVVFEGHGCTAQACHGEARQGELDLRPDAAYQSLVDVRSKGSALARVQPGTAKESYLYLK